MNFLAQAVKALPTIAVQPLAFAGYALVVGAWLVAYWRTRRFELLMKDIKQLPQKDREAAIQLEFNTILPSRIDADQWLKGKRHKYYLIAYVVTLVSVIIFVWFVFQRAGRNTRLTDQFKASERPYVSFGSRDGNLIQIREGSDGEPFLALYFYNAGKTPARRFLVDAFSNARIPIVRHDRHLARFAESNPGDPTFSGLVTVRGDGDIAAESTFIHYLDKQYSPDRKEWEGLGHGQTVLEGNPGHLEAYPFQVFGTFEYCDVFGGYHCDSVAANYS